MWLEGQDESKHRVEQETFPEERQPFNRLGKVHCCHCRCGEKSGAGNESVGATSKIRGWSCI